jgi:hypothetical protein
VVVVPNAVDADKLSGLAHEGLASLGTRADIVTVGRLVSNKGYDLLARALVDEHHAERVVWRHFGSGPERRTVEAIVAEDPLVELEVVEGAPDSVVQANLAHCGIFVQPSRYEGSSLTTLEAMAQRATCVGTAVGGIGDKLQDGQTGFLARSTTSSDLAEALSRARTAPRAIANAAHDRVRLEYSLRSVAATIADLLTGCPVPTETGGTAQPRLVFQVARHIGDGTGVAQVVKSIEGAMTAREVVVGGYTLRDSGLRSNVQISSNPLAKLGLLLEVVWFTVRGSAAARRLESQGAEVIVHGDPIGGTIFVNHGLLKASRRARKLAHLPPAMVYSRTRLLQIQLATQLNGHLPHS